jgi:hypothetical protein
LPAPQATANALDRFLEARQALRIGEAHVMPGLVTAEIKSRGKGYMLGFKEVSAERKGIAAESTDVRI